MMGVHSFLVTAASFFPAEIQDVSPFTSPGNSHIRVEAEEPKPPVSEMPSWTISERGDSSVNVADSTDDLGAFEHAQRQGRVSSPLPRDLGPLRHVYGKNHHDPNIDDTPHVNLTSIPPKELLALPPPFKMHPRGNQPFRRF